MTADRDLVLTRDIPVASGKLYRCWTEPELIKQWFAPRPWTTSHAETDVRPGGSSLVVMRAPDGQEYPNHGVYLAVERNERLVTTDAYTSAWEPSPKPFMTLILTFERLNDAQTRYTALARHWTQADRQTHASMGFAEGWSRCTDQLAELAARL